MRANTKKRKKATVMLKATQEQEWFAGDVHWTRRCSMSAALAEAHVEREERSGPDYHPTSSGLMKWASQRG